MVFARPIAITDVETTGLDPTRVVSSSLKGRYSGEYRLRFWHEIIEIGLVLVDQSMNVIDKWEVKVRPERIDLASPEALAINGYKPENWKEAVGLDRAMRIYAEKTKGAIFCAHNMIFNWSFLKAASSATGVDLEMDYHRLDLQTMAWILLRHHGLQRTGLDAVAECFRLPPETKPHNALNGAMLGYEVLKRLTMMA